jgi:hypothetical protein
VEKCVGLHDLGLCTSDEDALACMSFDVALGLEYAKRSLHGLVCYAVLFHQLIGGGQFPFRLKVAVLDKRT